MGWFIAGVVVFIFLLCCDAESEGRWFPSGGGDDGSRTSSNGW